MNDIDLILILYLILTLLISFISSFLYLNYFRNKELTSLFSFYFCVFCFGLIIYHIFLVPLDHAISFKTNLTKLEDSSTLINDLLKILEIYYQYFGYFSEFVNIIFGPIMIFFYTTGFYYKCDICKDIGKRLFEKYFTLFNICLILILLIPIFVLLYLGKLYEFYENEFKLFLNYLNYYSYLKILFYIGFIIKHKFIMYILKNNEGEIENYNIWKLGKLYLYYEREKINIKKNYDKIKIEIEQYFKEHPNHINDDFNKKVEEFEKYVKFSLTNIIYIEPDIEGINLSNEKYRKKYEFNNDQEIMSLIKKNENGNFIDEDDNFNDTDNRNINLNNQNDQKEINFLEKNTEKCKRNFENEEKSGCCTNCSSCCFSCCKCCKKGEKIYENFKEFKNEICSLMDIVYESCVSIQRKSFLINQKYIDLFSDEKKQNCLKRFLNCLKINLIKLFFIILGIILIVLEFSIFELKIPNNIDKDKEYKYTLLIWLIFFISVITYFLIFNDSIIHHQYIEGEIIYGLKKSQNVNYYNFISLMFDLINALLFHSVWVLNKSQNIEAKFSKVFILKPIYYQEQNIIPYISFSIILICIYNTVTFSKLKIGGKTKIVFNENADFFEFNENFYGNFYIGCGCLIFIAKNGLNYKNELDIIDTDIRNIDINEKEKQNSLLLGIN